MKNEAEEYKKLMNYIPWLLYCYVYCITSSNLYRIRENHTQKFQFRSYSFFFLSFFLLRTLLENYSVYANIPRT